MAQPPGLSIHGARQNNLKNISLEIPHDKLTVVTGVSGSGKSSVAFDPLFAEGQWRYIESLSTYARMFLDRVDRPDVDRIEQIRPAVALEQKNPVRTARSTVGTATEVYDYLRLLYAKIGRVHCPECGAPAASHSPDSIVSALLAEHPGARALIAFRLSVPAGLPPAELWTSLTRRGFARVRVNGSILDLAAPPPADFGEHKDIAVVLDRVVQGGAEAAAEGGARAGDGPRHAVGEASRARAPARLRGRRRLSGHHGVLRGDRVLPLQAPRPRLPLALPEPVPLPDVPRRAAQARGPRGPRRRAHDLRVHRAHDRERRAPARRAQAHGLGGRRRARDPPPARRQADVPPAPRARLPDARAPDAHAVGRRGAADQPREPAGLTARGNALRPRRPIYWPPCARHDAARRALPRARARGQHRRRRRARPRGYRRPPPRRPAPPPPRPTRGRERPPPR